MPGEVKIQAYVDRGTAEELRQLAGDLNTSMSTMVGLLLQAQLRGKGDRYIELTRQVAAEKRTGR